MEERDPGREEARLEALLRRGFPIYEYVGLEVRAARDGIYRCFVPLRESNLNHIGTVHAAIQWAASEVLGGLVMMSIFHSRPVFGVVKGVSIEFKRPARSHITVEATFSAADAEEVMATFESEGEAGFKLKARVLDDSGVEVAASEAEYLARKPRGG